MKPDILVLPDNVCVGGWRVVVVVVVVVWCPGAFVSLATRP